MSINPHTEKLLTFKQASRLFPGGFSPGTLRKWADSGCAGVILESFRIGPRVFTTVEAYDRFMQVMNQGRELA